MYRAPRTPYTDTMLRPALAALCLELGACATQPPPAPEIPRTELFADARPGASIAGAVVDVTTHARIDGALVILQCNCLQGQREMQTGPDGIYRFRNLPPGKYTVQVLFAHANVNKAMDVAADARFAANFTIDPKDPLIGCDLGSFTPRRFSSGHSWVLMGNLDLPLAPPPLRRW